MYSPSLVVSDLQGNIFDIPDLLMTGSSLNLNIIPDDKNIIPLPKSSVLFTLPMRIPIGYDTKQKKFVEVKKYMDITVFAVAAFMPPGYIRTLHSSYIELPDAPKLPLYCYSAVGFKNGRFFVAGYCIDSQKRHQITEKILKTVKTKANIMLKKYPHNRLVSHLINNCVYKYTCPNACNFVLGRWECPVPVSSLCNSFCIGCISKQPKNSGFASSQDRIDFTPTAQEIIEYVVPHMKTAKSPIASFGQGCEGEPLLKIKLIEESIRDIRRHTNRGIININTNASKPGAIERLCKAGLNSIRISMNSAQQYFYNSYYRPGNYTFDDVMESIKIAVKYKVWISINYLIFPGFTDTPSEIRALESLIRNAKINMIQTRNLNIDPLLFRKSIITENYFEKSIGMINWIRDIKTNFPELLLGYFNPTGKMIRAHRK